MVAIAPCDHARGSRPWIEDRSLWMRDEHYYLEDGNIIILAEQLILFRVHRSLLCMHSDVLTDKLAELPTDGDTEDGCPLLRVQHKASEIRLLFDTFYRGATTPLLNPQKELEMRTIAPMMNVATCYHVQHLRTAALSRLHAMFPSQSLEDWRPLHDGMASARVKLTGSMYSELLAIVRLTRKFSELASLLPLVLYAICQLPVYEIAAQDTLACLLGDKDPAVCLQAVPKLQMRKLEIYNVFTLQKLRENCQNMSTCDKTLLQLSHDIMMRDDVTKLQCPLEDIGDWCRGQESWQALCEPCTKAIVTEIFKCRLATWNELGDIFGIPGWPQAANADTATPPRFAPSKPSR